MTIETRKVPGTGSIRPVLLRPEQAAEALNIGRTAVFALIRSGRRRSVKVGGLRRIPASALAEFVRTLEEEQAE
ncbi:MAG TPA: helix-turn-helix domain-containing protein [Streptosporangiaceae bacterium]|jgi:excisionase family DNA binding protein|nr:helix-turn-helix domain-containing protein [Streptosporangiaceae bacterium]